jgi:hypothetical protein
MDKARIIDPGADFRLRRRGLEELVRHGPRRAIFPALSRIRNTTRRRPQHHHVAGRAAGHRLHPLPTAARPAGSSGPGRSSSMPRWGSERRRRAGDFVTRRARASAPQADRRRGEIAGPGPGRRRKIWSRHGSDSVRGILATIHAFAADPALSDATSGRPTAATRTPFVGSSSGPGLYRAPSQDPQGTNICEIGREEAAGSVVSWAIGSLFGDGRQRRPVPESHVRLSRDDGPGLPASSVTNSVRNERHPVASLLQGSSIHSRPPVLAANSAWTSRRIFAHLARIGVAPSR